MSSIKTNGTIVESATIPGPLGRYVEQFQKHMAHLRYCPDSIRQYMKCLAALADRMIVGSVDIADLDPEMAADLIADPGESANLSKYRRFIVARFIEFLSGLGAVKASPGAAPDDTIRGRLKLGYEEYLRRQRGLSDRTIFHSWRMADRFLTFRFGKETGDPSEITADNIAAFLQHVAARKSPLRDKTLSSHLRNFFRYLFQTGKTTANLSLGVPSVAQRYGTRLPRHLTPDQVNTLIAAVRTDTVTGRRNYAMVLLIARLGLRAPEVVAMQIDDVDWRSGEIIVRGKGQRHDRVPLPPEVGEAIAVYVRQDRVTATRALFVTDRAPHLPFKGSGILNTTLRDAFRKTGLKPPPPYVGSHVLRHSLATSLLQRGASLEEISDTLRHRSRDSTMIYARLDIDGLRSIAQPWPVAGRGK